MGIAIPEMFACLNAKRIFHNWNADYYYADVHAANGGRPSDCAGCAACESMCPQHLPIRRLLQEVCREFDK